MSQIEGAIPHSMKDSRFTYIGFWGIHQCTYWSISILFMKGGSALVYILVVLLVDVAYGAGVILVG